MKQAGILRYSERLHFYIETPDKRRFQCSDYEQTVCTRNELLKEFTFHINENDEAFELDLMDDRVGRKGA